jgi:hypothetical protein
MAFKILDENGVDALLLEDGTGVILLEEFVAPDSVPNALMMMGIGDWAVLFLFILL